MLKFGTWCIVTFHAKIRRSGRGAPASPPHQVPEKHQIAPAPVAIYSNMRAFGARLRERGVARKYPRMPPGRGGVPIYNQTARLTHNEDGASL